MKKIIILTTVLAAGMLMGASSQTASAPPGTDNIAAGYGAGYKAGGVNTDVVCIGTDAGLGSTNNTRCVFIGKNAGKGVKNKTDYIDIGGVFKADGGNIDIGGVFAHTNGETTIKGFRSAAEKIALSNVTNANGTAVTATDVGALPKSWYRQYSPGAGYYGIIGEEEMGWCFAKSATADMSEWGAVFQITTDGQLKRHSEYGWDWIWSKDENENFESIGQFVEKRLSDKMQNMSFKFENGSVSVYTNGTKAGTLTFTPSP